MIKQNKHSGNKYSSFRRIIHEHPRTFRKGPPPPTPPPPFQVPTPEFGSLTLKDPRVTNVNFLPTTLNTSSREKVMRMGKLITRGKIFSKFFRLVVLGNVWR